MSKTLKSLLQDVEVIETRGDLGIPITGLSQDSRQVQQGNLFIALRGVHQDGSMFVADAVRRGASAILTDSSKNNGLPEAYIRVADSRKAMSGIAASFYDHPAEKLQLIGITGTNGKTTTSLLLESILQQDGGSVGVLGTLAYRWADKHEKAPMTTPDAIDLNRIFQRMSLDGVGHVVMEVSSHALSLGRIEGCRFKAAVFTNLSQDHLDYHRSMEDYFQAKTLLFTNHLDDAAAEAVAVVNRDDPHGIRLIAGLNKRVWSYSISDPKATVRTNWFKCGTEGIRADFAAPQGKVQVRSALLGKLNVYNMLAAVTTALALGVSPEVVSAGVEAVKLVDGRLQRVPIPAQFGFEVIVDYAHTPDAMEKSLECLKEITGGRLLVVFGCGGDRDRGKRPLMGAVAARFGDLVILTSDNPRSEVPAAIIREIEPGVRALGVQRIGPHRPAPGVKGYAVEEDRKKAIELALAWAAPGDIVFIGGKGHETYQIIAGQVASFDDRVVVQNHVTASPANASAPKGKQSENALDRC